MSTIRPVQLEDADGTTYTVCIESTEPAELPNDPNLEPTRSGDRESYGLGDRVKAEIKADARNIHGTIRAYTWYVIGAFKNLSDVEIEEINLKFGIKIGGEVGMPIFTKGTAESNFEVSVKCKFPNKSPE
ncbi:CU044_2847 family protein [cf. Phormidesmis sp. LEGE 11477]|uniref:CU044_2847 family protein n=1 Tax=cf. Phormidesmis sp. LEGE 11477 TaxID=1828680 RepID=UPI0018804ADD|nr:CU044_2847 family protein [cf. Phormidesmis sp. LEGE 11477]MBE9063382.1 hypothetical protein [cf. Phormidesmis sp. LEGE 11477]